MNISGAPDSFVSKLPKECRQKDWISGDEAQRRFKRGEEKTLQRLIANYLNLNGIYFEQDRMDKRTSGKVGRPDFRLCYHGNFVAIECKADGESLSPEQFREFIRIRQSGGLAYVAYSLQDLISFLPTVPATAS